MVEIFISYARENRATTEQLAQALERQGWSVWWDRHIPAGRRFDEVIADRLANAHCVLALWSKEAIHSEWVAEEAEAARERGVLMPALIEAVAPPLGFRRIHAADLIGWTGTTDHPGFRQLVRDIDTALLLRRGATARGSMELPPQGQATVESPVQAHSLAACPRPAGVVCDPIAVRAIEHRLARSIGPVAPVAVERALRNASDLPTLVGLLGRHVPDDAERARFLRDGLSLADVGKSPEARPVHGRNDAAAPPTYHAITIPLPIADTCFGEIEKALARHIGPIARVVLKRAVAQCGSAEELCASLLNHIDREDDRRQFSAMVTRLV